MLFFPTLLLHYMLNLRYLELRKFSSQSWLGSKSDSFHWPDAPIWDTDFTRLAKFSISLGQQQVSQYSRVAILHVPLHSCSFIQEQQKLRIEHSTCFLTVKASPLCSQFLRPLCTIFTFGWVLIESTLLIGHAGTLCQGAVWGVSRQLIKTQHRSWPDTPDLAKSALLSGNFPGTDATSWHSNHILSFQKINKLAT